MTLDSGLLFIGHPVYIRLYCTLFSHVVELC